AGLNYYKYGYMCDDCDQKYYDCACEGSRNDVKLDSLGKRIYEPCEDCKANYCVCDLDIFNNKNKIIPDKVRKEGWRIARETLDYQKLNRTIRNLYFRISDNNIENEKWLNVFIDIIKPYRNPTQLWVELFGNNRRTQFGLNNIELY